jgi:hypothetical protein
VFDAWYRRIFRYRVDVAVPTDELIEEAALIAIKKTPTSAFLAPDRLTFHDDDDARRYRQIYYIINESTRVSLLHRDARRLISRCDRYFMLFFRKAVEIQACPDAQRLLVSLDAAYPPIIIEDRYQNLESRLAEFGRQRPEILTIISATGAHMRHWEAIALRNVMFSPSYKASRISSASTAAFPR